jgi:hypothetical protein
MAYKRCSKDVKTRLYTVKVQGYAIFVTTDATVVIFCAVNDGQYSNYQIENVYSFHYK